MGNQACCASSENPAETQVKEFTDNAHAEAATALLLAEVKEVPVPEPVKPKEEPTPEPPTVEPVKPPEPVPPVPEVPSKEISVTFTPPMKSVCFYRQATGLALGGNGNTLSLAAVSGDAAELGLRKEMAIVSINGAPATADSYEKNVAELPSEVKGVRLTCVSANGEEKNVFLMHKPAGFSFGTTAPLTLTKVEGRAELSGLQVGMTVRNINGEDVSALAYAQSSKILTDNVSSLPSALPVKVTFATEEGAKKEICFCALPLGMTYEGAAPQRKDRAPLVVTSSIGQALKLGVQVGWACTSIEGADVCGLAYNPASNKMKQAALRLPPQPPCLEMVVAEGLPKKVTFKARPLGLSLDGEKSPLKVLTATGPAAAAGVTAGWAVSEIEGTGVQSMDRTAAKEVLDQAENQLPG